VAELLVAILLDGDRTNPVSLLTCRWYGSHDVAFRDGTTAHIEAIGRHESCVRICRDKRDVSLPKFYVLPRTTGELVDLYIVADKGVATWKGEQYRTSRPPPPANAESCEIDIPHPHAILYRRAVKATEDRDPLGRSSGDWRLKQSRPGQQKGRYRYAALCALGRRHYPDGHPLR
jgi:hypothetical protein